MVLVWFACVNWDTPVLPVVQVLDEVYPKLTRMEVPLGRVSSQSMVAATTFFVPEPTYW